MCHSEMHKSLHLGFFNIKSVELNLIFLEKSGQQFYTDAILAPSPSFGKEG